MDEQATFETRAVLAPKRSRRNRVALLVPALALVATAWAGLSGRSEQGIGPAPSRAVASQGAVAAATSGAATRPDVQHPTEALGFEVRPLDEVNPRALDADQLVAVAGWYFMTEISDCPPLSDVFRETAQPGANRRTDPWRFCERSGVLFATQPLFKGGQPASDFDENRIKNSGLPAINVSVDEHVIMPAPLEVIGGDATAVVVLGRFVQPDDRCHWPMECPRQLVVDHIAWSAG